MSSLPARPKQLNILGTRGIPAAHGGFETFAERLAIYLVARDWEVSVYCQVDKNKPLGETVWNGIRLVQIPVGDSGPLATIIFDLRATLHAANRGGLILTLGYNTAIFLAWLKLRGITNLINMDGIEWRRSKWSFPQRCWLFMNERLAPWFADHLIADHPEIKAHHARHVDASRITAIPYGAPLIDAADHTVLQELGLESKAYVLVVARAEPENSILEIVRSFCSKPRGLKLVLVGKYFPDRLDYHRQVIEAGNDEVKMIGPLYDHEQLSALRFHARLHVHGHRVGGTNPSLVEALGAGNPILAHDNPFNRWVAGPQNAYFQDEQDCAEQFDVLLNNAEALESMQHGSRQRHAEAFLWPDVLASYETLLETWLPVAQMAQPETSPHVDDFPQGGPFAR